MSVKRNLTIIAIIVIIISLVAGLAIFNKSTELREKAAIPQGSASIELDPGELEEGILKGTSVSLKLTTRVSTPTDGFQVVANFTGTVPSDLQFNPDTPAGLELAYVNLSDTDTGKQLQAVYVSQNPTQPVGSPADPLGTITFTSPGSGTLTISFDPLKSIIAENQTSQDVLTTPASYRYSFISPLPSPKPSTRPRRSPIPSVKPPIQ